ncbi:hypothetical protein AVEN_11165-1 [Araneus ventricosus]|uniref:Uncharacterized protein n=1 Tax=Araneus ventricosus TaxID=182803 RepID=A0A4Y2M4J6_ARAVE|nr:hypothetical protein AVEN_11165-1 [Araneus ventricosus]
MAKKPLRDDFRENLCFNQAAAASLAPVHILKGDAEEERREDARLPSIFGSIAIGDFLKSTLGPKGMVRV